MKHFINNEFSAPNVITVPFDPALLEGLRATIQKPLSKSDYTVVSPPWSSDIKWISPNSIQSYKFFLAIFESLGIAQHVKPFVDFDKLIRMYTGVVVLAEGRVITMVWRENGHSPATPGKAPRGHPKIRFGLLLLLQKVHTRRKSACP